MDGESTQQTGTAEKVTPPVDGGEDLAQQAVGTEKSDFVPLTREEFGESARDLLEQVVEGNMPLDEAVEILEKKVYGPQEAEGKKDETEETQSKVEKTEEEEQSIAKKYLSKRLSELSDDEIEKKIRKTEEEDIQPHGLTAEQARQDAENEQKKVREVLDLLESSNSEEAKEGLKRAKELVGAYYQESVIAKNLVQREEESSVQPETERAKTPDDVIDMAKSQEARMQEEESFEKEHADLRETASYLGLDVEELDKLAEEENPVQLLKASAEVNRLLGRKNLEGLSLQKAIQILEKREKDLENLIDKTNQEISESKSGREKENREQQTEEEKATMSREKKIQLLKSVGKGVGIFMLLMLISAGQEA